MMDIYGGCMLVRWCMSRCVGVGMGSLPRICCVLVGDYVWKYPTNKNEVFLNLFVIVFMAFITGEMHEYVSLCWTS